jgi:hypothetical protein
MKARRGPGSDAQPLRPVGPHPLAQPHPLELFGLAELVEMTGWSPTNRVRLRALLPPPDFELRMGPIWTGDTVHPWIRQWQQSA